MTDKCIKCGADMVFNPKTQKTFCSAKCWLEAAEKGKQLANMPSKDISIIAQTMTKCYAMTHNGSKMTPEQIWEVYQQFIKLQL